MKKLLAALMLAMFAAVTVNAFAASHTGAQPTDKDKKEKSEMKKDGKKKDEKDKK